jgi:hypothetical protein
MAVGTHPVLECSDLFVGQSVGLRDDRDQVDLSMQSLHHFNVQRLQGVSCGLDEEHAGMNTVVNNVHAVDLVLCIQVSVKALLNVVNDWPPRFVVVDEVAKARRIDYSEAKSYAGFLNVRADGLDGDSLRDDVETGSLALLRRVQGGVEQGVHERRLS